MLPRCPSTRVGARRSGRRCVAIALTTRPGEPEIPVPSPQLRAPARNGPTGDPGSREVVTARAWFVAAVVALALVAASCGSSSAKATAGSIGSLAQDGVEYSLVQAQSALTPGESRFVFGMVPRDGEPLAGGSVEVWVARDRHSRAAGPFPASWVTWTADEDDPTGAPPVEGFYVTTLEGLDPGDWLLFARTRRGGRRITGEAAMTVDPTAPALPGSKAISEATPVATDPAEAAKIDTREPPTPMHYISLDDALANGLPTVVVFATPLLCQSRMCGPVVDEVLDVYHDVGTAQANFVDVEIYPSRDPNQPSAAFLRWGFDSEPWVLVIDESGTVAARFEGPVTAPEVLASLRPLLDR